MTDASFQDRAQSAENFARLLVEVVRDPAVATMLSTAEGKIGGPTGQAWRAADEEERIRLAIALGVDEAVFRLLEAIDNAVLDLRWVAESGELIELAGSGMGDLGGEYLAEDGWRDRFSRQVSYPGL